MNFFQRLFSKPEPPKILAGRLSGSGAFAVEVSELSTKNLDLFWKATSNQWHRKEGERDFFELQADATLVSDLENRIPHAIAVEIGGKRVGHLRHPDALRLHRRLKALGYDTINSKCDANIVGRTGYWMVNVDFDVALPDIKPAKS